MRRGLAVAILGAASVVSIAAIGASVRGPFAEGSLATDLAAGAIVVGIVAAVAWAEHELEAARDSE